MPCRCAKKTSEAAQSALVEAMIALQPRGEGARSNGGLAPLMKIVELLSPLFKEEDVAQKMRAHPMSALRREEEDERASHS